MTWYKTPLLKHIMPSDTMRIKTIKAWCDGNLDFRDWKIYYGITYVYLEFSREELLSFFLISCAEFIRPFEHQSE